MLLVLIQNQRETGEKSLLSERQPGCEQRNHSVPENVFNSELFLNKEFQNTPGQQVVNQER